METVSVVSRKGGVGKTATALALGAGLRRKGFSVLYVDLDSQCNLTAGLQASAGRRGGSLAVLEGTASAEDVICHTAQGDIVPATEDIALADTLIIGKGREYRLQRALASVEGDYDYVVIDTPAALNILTINALTASQSAIIPVQADIDSLQGIAQLGRAIQAVQRASNPELRIRGILLTRFSGRAILSRDMQENFMEAAKQIGTTVFKTPIRECVALREAKAQQCDIYTYASRSNAAKDYGAFLDEFLASK